MYQQLHDQIEAIGLDVAEQAYFPDVLPPLPGVAGMPGTSNAPVAAAMAAGSVLTAVASRLLGGAATPTAVAAVCAPVAVAAAAPVGIAALAGTAGLPAAAEENVYRGHALAKATSTPFSSGASRGCFSCGFSCGSFSGVFASLTAPRH